MGVGGKLGPQQLEQRSKCSLGGNQKNSGGRGAKGGEEDEGEEERRGLGELGEQRREGL